MKQKLVILTSCLCFSFAGYAQTDYTGSNSCLIQVATDVKEYQFSTANMNARLNDAMERFEFTIPLSSIKSLGDSSDEKFLKSFANGNDTIFINAVLPGDKDSQIDLSYFQGNESINLAGEIRIGRFTFEDDINFKGLLMEGNQKMAFDFTIFLNERALSTVKNLGQEQIIEIKLAARGDKIIGLTSNQ